MKYTLVKGIKNSFLVEENECEWEDNFLTFFSFSKLSFLLLSFFSLEWSCIKNSVKESFQKKNKRKQDVIIERISSSLSSFFISLSLLFISLSFFPALFLYLSLLFISFSLSFFPALFLSLSLSRVIHLKGLRDSFCNLFQTVTCDYLTGIIVNN